MPNGKEMTESKALLMRRKSIYSSVLSERIIQAPKLLCGHSYDKQAGNKYTCFGLYKFVYLHYHITSF
jgi:hypothetical protein